MTESKKAINERAIYEWLGYKFDTDGTARFREMYGWLPTLDMDLAFGKCIPKLLTEGVKVMYNNMGSGEWWLDAPNKDGIYNGPDFYKNLVTYIRGVK